MRFVPFVKRCDTPTLIRCLMEAFEYFAGLTKVALTDRMKSVLLEMVENKPRWNARFADFMVSIGVAARVCKAYTPQTKGKVERTVSHVKKSFWGGVTFTDLDDLASPWRMPGASASTPASIARRMFARWIVWPRRSCCPCQPILPGNASPPKSAKSPGMATFRTMACSMGCQGHCNWQANRSRCVSAREWSRSGQRANRCLRVPNVRDRKTACR